MRVMVQQEMKRRGIAYKDIAAAAECSVDALRKFIKRDKSNKWQRIIKICDYLDITFDEYLVTDCNDQVADLIDYANAKGCRVRFAPCVKPTYMGLDKRDDVPQLWIPCHAENPMRIYSLLALITEADRRRWIELAENERDKLQMATWFLRTRVKEKQSPGMVNVLGGYPQDECFAVRVDDEGFAPDILPGDTIIIHKQPTVENGELAAVSVDGDVNTLLRRVHHTEHGLILTADNNTGKRFEPITIDADELHRIHFYGKIVSLVRNYDKAAEDVGE